MGSFELRWKASAIKELKGLPGETRVRILAAATALATEPFPPGSRKLRGSWNAYRLRVGDYRIVYGVLAAELMIEIVRIGHRSDVYRDLDR